MKSAALVILLTVAATSTSAAPDVGRVKRLTTFSKPPEQNIPAIGTRECKSQEECTIKGTICTEDRRDTRRRCLCEDGNPPSNGQCPNRKRVRRGYLPTGNRRPYTGLREKCNRDEECMPQAHCILNTTVHRTNKVCLCEPDAEEVDNMCGGSERLVETGFLIAMGLAAYMLDGRP